MILRRTSVLPKNDILPNYLFKPDWINNSEINPLNQ